MDVELLRWSLWLNIFLILACIGATIGGVFWGLSVGQRLGAGVPVDMFGVTRKGEVWQAPEPAGDKNPGAYQAGGATMQDPLAFLDEHINRGLKQMGSVKTRNLLDPELAGLSPTQAGRGGE